MALAHLNVGWQFVAKNNALLLGLLCVIGLATFENLAWSTPANNAQVGWPSEDRNYVYEFQLGNPELHSVEMNLSVSLHCRKSFRNAPIAFRDIVVQLGPGETRQHRELFQLPPGAWVSSGHHRLNTTVATD